MQPQGPDQQKHGSVQPHHIPLSQLKDQLSSGGSVGILSGDNAGDIETSAIKNNNKIARPSQQSAIQPIAAVPQSQPTATPAPSVPISTTNNPPQQYGSNQNSVNTQPNGSSTNTQPPQAVVNQNPSKQQNESMSGSLLVKVQFSALVLIAVGFFPSQLFFNTFLMIFGVILIAIGVYIGVWAIMSFNQKISSNPAPLKHSFLVTSGPYKYMRHPMYMALIYSSLGLTMVYPTIIRVIALVVLVLILVKKIYYEEKYMLQRYNHYDRYARLTGQYIPKFKKPDIDIDLPKL